MKKMMEKTAILSLSLILISTFAVSCVLPKMLEHFQEYSRENVELLISLPSLGIACMIVLNIFLTRIMSERFSIILGSVIIASTGLVMMVSKSYPVFMVSRFVLGLGIGLINARAITIIQSRFEGKERDTLLGIRGSMEVLGNTVLTFLAGRLMSFGWNAAYGVYLLIIPILLMYLAFVKPDEDKAAGKKTAGKKAAGKKTIEPSDEAENIETLTLDAEDKQTSAEQQISAVQHTSVLKHIPFFISLFFFGWIFISSNTAVTMRMANLMLDKSLGTEADASIVLSFMLICGVAAGLLFELLLRIFKNKIVVFGLLCMGGGAFLIAIAGNTPMLYMGGALSGFANGILPTILFRDIAEKLPGEHMDMATYVTLLGCNLGAASSPMVLKWIGLINDSMTFSYLFYGIVCAVLAAIMFVSNNKKSAKA